MGFEAVEVNVISSQSFDAWRVKIARTLDRWMARISIYPIRNSSQLLSGL